MSHTNWEADKMLDVYIHDYLVKRGLKASAQAFQAEGKISCDPVAIDAPGGFLFEWWSVFWDIFIARTNEKHSEVASSYIETQFIKAREQQPQNHPQPNLQQQQQFHMPQNRQAQLQQQQSQRQQQQQQQQAPQPQRRDGGHLLNGSTNELVGTDALSGQTANTMTTKMYEERLKMPLPKDSLDDASMKQRFADNVSQLLDQNHASVPKPAANGQPSSQVLHGTAGCMSPQIQPRNQQLPGSVSDIKEMNSVLNHRGAAPETSMIGLPGSNQGGNNLTLKGWPLTGLEQLRSGLLQQQQKSLMQASQPFHQFQMLTPQHQQQLMIAQHNLASAAANDMDNNRLRTLITNRSMGLGKEGLPNSIGDTVPNVGSPLQGGCPALPRRDADMLIKLKMAQLQQQHQQSTLPQHQLQQLKHNGLSFSGQSSQVSNHSLHQPDKLGGTNGIAVDGNISNSFRGNDQASKYQTGRKRKQPLSSSAPANSSGTANTTGPSPSSAPSTPSTHTPGDVMSMASFSKPPLMFGSDANGALASPSNHLADMERFVEDGSLDDNVESFLSHDDSDPRDPSGRSMDLSKGFTFTEVSSLRASSGKVVCCHFSADGKLLATGGHDKKAVLWYSDSLKPKTTLDEHTNLITDVRFSPSMSRLATSSFDKSVRVWDVDNPGYSLRNFMGHSATVMSLDFHPNKDDLICSCDGDGEIRYWSVTNGNCARVLKGGNTQVRFQPRHGRYLAAAAENVISIFDVETQTCQHRLQGHTKQIHSVCWDPCGEFLASVSEDSVRVWSVGQGSKGECVHELSCNGNKFYSCAFHPTYTSLLVIGCYQSMELWNMVENKTMTLSAHDGLIASLAASSASGLVASASHDKIVKLWK
ncbi:hypothetical protein RND81_03G127200 [Saponaria officinalis]|uniref:Transcriptional corepressor LEUNIG-like n=1 Tax=Saponaria officinalis TaxID=3572 RepID=A0AAW1M7C5_SAPOF